MRYGIWEKDGVITLLAEPEEDGVKFFMLEELSEGDLFWGEIPYDELKKFAPGMVDIDPDTFALTAVPLIDV
jgi:hypothetical protein